MTNAAAVRDYFRTNPVKSEVVTRNVNGRGRLHPETIAAFESATGKTFDGHGVVAPTVTLPLTKLNRRGARIKRPESFAPAEVRAFAGEPSNKRGRLSASVVEKATAAVIAERGWDVKPS